MSSAKQSLVDGPILSTLLRLSAPNVVALSASAVITIAETAYVGRLGVASLAGVALVFPIVMLMQMMSAGAMGGTISGAISRAIGAGNSALAAAVACNAAVIGAAAGTLFAGLLWLLGPLAFRALGGSGTALAEATAYAQVVAPAFIVIWLANTFASIARGMGVMSQPALILLAAGGLQITAGGALAFGFGFLPAWGVAGVAAGQVIAFALAAMAMLRLLKSPRVPLVFSFDISLINTKVMAELLRPGLLACLSPIQSVATVLVLTAIVARFGEDALAGYSVGSRLEFLLIPVAFAIGVGSVPMVGTAIGSGNVARARRVAWLAGALAAAALAIIGMIVAIAPDVWARIFVSDGPVLEVTREYLQIASIGYPFFGLALCLYFAAQGAAKVGGVIIAQTIRLVLIITGGWIILAQAWPLWTVFALSALAMFVQGLASLMAIRLSNWAPRGAKP